MPKNVIKEKEDFQRYILDYLSDNNGYIIRDAKSDFNNHYAMDIELLFKFLYDTQYETMDKLEKIYKDKTKDTIINYLNNEITKLDKNTKTAKRGLLDVLKHGIEFDNGIKLNLMYRKPATSFNTELNAKYQTNIFSVMEEVYHKEGERIDLVIFLNGLAIMSFELKSNTSGQSYKDAIKQYKLERDYKTRLFMFKAGCLVNFAMDLKEVYMTTWLKGKSTYFLPFNKGTLDGGAGNPTNENGDFNVSYMWEDILKKDTVLELIDKFIFVQVKKEEDEKTAKVKYKETLIFPRYHQLNCLRNLLSDVKSNKSTQNYLIQHSAGSGKTNTIAWLSHRLSSLHDYDEKQIFDNIIIITDRIVVDRQLQDAVLALEHKEGLIKVMDDKCTSSDLADALNGNTKIIVSTIQKFRFILDLVKTLKKKTFAVIIDEAHSSTAGANMAAVTQALANDEENEDDVETLIANEIAKNGKQANVSMFAFTATPKPQTLQMFGTMNVYGNKQAFDLYSMKQAIEEGFILDVLQNYMTYKTYYQLNKTIEDDPVLQTSDAKRQIARFIELHDTNIAQKVEIIVEHFKHCVLESGNNDISLNGHAKAMVVTSSREAAVKYRNAFEEYINKKGYKNIKALVAFSGKVKIDGTEYTEPSMNGFAEDKLAKQFDSDDYKVLLVANKYQTGFDQPKLVAMYVDKKLKDIAAVQTLSRLNRICPPYNKIPFVLDFKNEYEDIQKAFEPYYKDTILGNTVTPSDIYKLSEKINQYNILDWDDIVTFNELLYKEDITSKDKIKMENLVDKALKKVYQYEKKKQIEIRSAIKSFNKFYTFLIQASCFEDTDIHRKYNFLSYLINEIDIDTSGSHLSLKDKISATYIRQKKTGEFNNPDLKGVDNTVDMKQAKTPTVAEIEMERLSTVIAQINNQTGNDFDADVTSKSLLQIKDILTKSKELEKSAKNNTLSNFGFEFNDQLDEALLAGLEQNQTFYSLLLNNENIKAQIMQVFLEDVYKALKNK
jgi:type I restriction enzyme R subunit